MPDTGLTPSAFSRCHEAAKRGSQGQNDAVYRGLVIGCQHDINKNSAAFEVPACFRLGRCEGHECQDGHSFRKAWLACTQGVIHRIQNLFGYTPQYTPQRTAPGGHTMKPKPKTKDTALDPKISAQLTDNKNAVDTLTDVVKQLVSDQNVTQSELSAVKENSSGGFDPTILIVLVIAFFVAKKFKLI